jgi:hypothetical protein
VVQRVGHGQQLADIIVGIAGLFPSLVDAQRPRTRIFVNLFT